MSENAKFAQICEESNIKFIGPKSEVIDALGNKSHSKELMKKCGIPVIPGSDGSVKSLEEAKKISKKIGYPIMLKASSGGGGKGIRVVFEEKDLWDECGKDKSKVKKLVINKGIY